MEKEFYPSTFTSRPRELTVVEAVGKGRVTYRFLYTMRHNDANKMITFPPPHPPPHPLLSDKIEFSKACFKYLYSRQFNCGVR